MEIPWRTLWQRGRGLLKTEWLKNSGADYSGLIRSA